MTAFMFTGVGLAWLADVIPVRQVYLSGPFVGAMRYFTTSFYVFSRRSMRAARLETDSIGIDSTAVSEQVGD